MGRDKNLVILNTTLSAFTSTEFGFVISIDASILRLHIQYIFMAANVLKLWFSETFSETSSDARVDDVKLIRLKPRKNIKSNYCTYNTAMASFTLQIGLRQDGRRTVPLGSVREKRRGGPPQQRKVRSLFLQPTWQHTVVSMLFMSRLVSSEPGRLLLLLLLRLSTLFCSPGGKPRFTKHNEHEMT